MTDAQQEALKQAAAETQPIKLHGTTARILHERYGFISPEGGGWTLTSLGRSYLAGEQADKRRRETEQRLSSEDRDWAKRVLAWMEAHNRAAGWSYGHTSHAQHVAACDHAGIESVALGQWADGAREYIEQAVRESADCLTDYDKALKLAEDRGVGVSIEYGANEKVPRSRRDAATAASKGSVVSLSTYRERRPNRGSAA